MKPIVNEDELREDMIEELANYANISIKEAMEYITQEQLDLAQKKMFEIKMKVIISISKNI